MNSRRKDVLEKAQKIFPIKHQRKFNKLLWGILKNECKKIANELVMFWYFERQDVKFLFQEAKSEKNNDRNVFPLQFFLIHILKYPFANQNSFFDSFEVYKILE